MMNFPVWRPKKEVNVYIVENTKLSKVDWDAYETSWDFKRHPLV